MAKPHIPEQKSRSETYRGVELNVWASREPTGKWVWSYTAGMQWGRHRGAQLPSAEAALMQGMLAARTRVC